MEDQLLDTMDLERERGITVFEKGDFENCGRILRTFYRTEDRVRKLLALGNLLHLGGSLSSNENKTSCWPLNNGNPIHEAKEISGKEKFFLLGDWTYLYENGREPPLSAFAPAIPNTRM